MVILFDLANIFSSDLCDENRAPERYIPSLNVRQQFTAVSDFIFEDDRVTHSVEELERRLG